MNDNTIKSKMRRLQKRRWLSLDSKTHVYMKLEMKAG